MIRYKDFFIFISKTNYKVFKDSQLICKFNICLNLTNVYKRISIVDLKEIIKFLQDEK